MPFVPNPSHQLGEEKDAASPPPPHGQPCTNGKPIAYHIKSETIRGGPHPDGGTPPPKSQYRKLKETILVHRWNQTRKVSKDQLKIRPSKKHAYEFQRSFKRKGNLLTLHEGALLASMPWEAGL